MNLINKLINKILINPAYTTNKCSQKSDFFTIMQIWNLFEKDFKLKQSILDLLSNKISYMCVFYSHFKFNNY